MSPAADNLILETKADLLRYFNAANFGALERQFNADGRLAPVMLDFDGPRVMIATAPRAPEGRIRVLDFPIHVSDFLGSVELGRASAEFDMVNG